ncbi:hypothetical protein Pmar_PMAR028157 [Perkinsus marinus ATCC 50983]|uniref:VWFA domain-containing protein n=1 Tax=Perkinsus marinus (strain ATCC 50983 / TXsc) TaxID=423536 RepID=C5LB42_PERM5|nr:hypothetical protein Pmar_PMAR028157 [Perkinsus marinus ATCC 50983]EER05970.1 hypothetical protein Pmar_PMAR028157 [Perkinsus marinus ATCC 50983]|eukprot:XP_002774154.1 hypothetical protein Pmar_PMAR028157 [Perkinsus marinus ATCC 50983]
MPRMDVTHADLVGPAKIRLAEYTLSGIGSMELTEICAHAQYCSAGDSTLDALRIATDRLLSTGPADEKLVMAFSDANLDRYGIHPKQLDAVLNRAADQVYAHVFFIASFDDQAEVLCRSIPKGKATVATNLSKLPQLIKEVLAATVNHQK